MNLAIDSGAVIWLISGNPSLAASIDRHLVRFERHLASALAITECLVRPLREANPLEISLFDSFFQGPTLSIAPVDRALVTEAARVRARFNLKLPDSVHLATAIVGGADEFLTTDHDFGRCVGHVPTAIRVVTP